MELQRVPSIAKYLSVVFLFAWTGRSTVWNFLPIFFENHMSVFWVGVATSLPPLVTLMFDIPVGNLVQHAGEKVVIFLGLLSCYISSFTVLCCCSCHAGFREGC